MDRELAREIGPHHPLLRLAVRSIGTRDANDDVVFASEASSEVFVVHLTFSGEREPRGYPATQRFASFSDFVTWVKNEDDYVILIEDEERGAPSS